MKILKSLKKIIRRNWLLDHIYLSVRYGTKHPFSPNYWDDIWKEGKDQSWRHYTALFDSIVALVPERSRVLDVGCGSGNLLQQLKMEKKCHVFCVDISKNAIDLCAKKGIPGQVDQLPELSLPSHHYDVVIATELIEHLHNPFKTLEQIHRVCKHYGFIFISTPNDFLPPVECDEHVHSFNEQSLKSLCAPVIQDISIQKLPYYYSGGSDALLLIGRKLG
jgi:2-polyprenyl-3-methyl-5-hydroxy-6-metoxy-1,4-benzoquinol methylase